MLITTKKLFKKSKNLVYSEALKMEVNGANFLIEKKKNASVSEL